MAIINGTAKNDILFDTDFEVNDVFNGKGGIDTLVSDTNWQDDVVFNMVAGEMQFEGDVYDTFRNIENLKLGGGADVIGDDNDNFIKFLGPVGIANQDNEVHAGGGNDKVFGGAGEDRLFGDAGKDILKGGAGDDNLFGGDGKDILKGGNGGDDLYGEEGNDILDGGTGNDRLLGDTGNDTLKGGKGKDYLAGSVGDDALKGGKGADYLNGGSGDDILTGGKGADTFFFYANGDSDVIEDFKDGTDLLDLSGFGFVDATEALGHFFERGSANNDVVGFTYDGTTIKIKGVDLADISVDDIIVEDVLL